MSVPKIETDRFDGKSDFVMWRRKMKAVLVQNKISPAICSPEEYPESWKGEILKEKLGHMKNKYFKRIKDEKQRKHGKGGNKVDNTHDFESDGNSMFSEVETISEPPLETPQEPETNSESFAPSSNTLVPETSDPILDGRRLPMIPLWLRPFSEGLNTRSSFSLPSAPRRGIATARRLFSGLVTFQFQLLSHLFDFLPAVSRRRCN
ncbi:hypothetical protein M9H77_35216 [Catharanthus roseus]|uniref:Uncharacterized protein n=1 Tax=Catharanthus roseus TaxID=4058 RepID=A0ACB9ZQZ2_CATRO|nr:hypothetical protein M9H77_35216 [Catharanthus roseus]